MKIIFLFFLVYTSLISLRANEDSPYKDALQRMLTLDIPKEFDTVHGFNPTTYLQMFTDEQVSRFTTDTGGLSPENEAKLKALFLAADKSGRAKYKQDYWISSKAPMVKLLAKVCPDILKLEQEPGGDLHMFEIALTLKEEQRQAKEKATGVSRKPDEELGAFYSAKPSDEERSRESLDMIRSYARNRFSEIALPYIASMIGEENDDFFLTVWWQHTNRSVRTSILAILLCRNDMNGGRSPDSLKFADFEGFSERFAEPEAKLRKEEIQFVKENFKTLALELARMTKGVKRLSKLHTAYSTAASIKMK